MDKKNYIAQTRPIGLDEYEDPKMPEANELEDLDNLLGKEWRSASARQIGGGHYKNFRIQPAEFVTANDIGFLEGCVIKRMCRHEDKNGKEDLLKAIHEIGLLIEYKYGD